MINDAGKGDNDSIMKLTSIQSALDWKHVPINTSADNMFSELGFNTPLPHGTPPIQRYSPTLGSVVDQYSIKPTYPLDPSARIKQDCCGRDR